MKDTLTLTLDGYIPARDFSTVVQRYTGLVLALATELQTRDDIDWSLDGLIGAEEGAAEAGITYRGEADEPEKVEQVVSAYGEVGKALEEQRAVPYSPAVVRHAKAITRVLNGKITAIRFHTPDLDATVYSGGQKPRPTPTLKAYGAVTGRIQTLTNRQGLRFTLYDAVYDKAVSCYLSEGQEEMMRGMWGKMAIVEGWISRDALTGRAIAIRQVSRVTPRPEVEPGSFLLARGALPAPPGAELPELTIRRLRDA